MVQVSNHNLENSRRSCRDTNSTIKCDGWTDRWIDRQTQGFMTEGKTICSPPFHGGGIKMYDNDSQSDNSVHEK